MFVRNTRMRKERMRPEAEVESGAAYLYDLNIIHLYIYN